MSIYATLWNIQVEYEDGRAADQWVEVFAQAVPAHIGHDSPKGDPFAGFLPPVSADYDPATGDGTHRAVVIVQAGRDNKDGQRYTDPLLVLTGEEYAAMPFQVLLDKIYRAIR